MPAFQIVQQTYLCYVSPKSASWRDDVTAAVQRVTDTGVVKKLLENNIKPK